MVRDWGEAELKSILTMWNWSRAKLVLEESADAPAVSFRMLRGRETAQQPSVCCLTNHTGTERLKGDVGGLFLWARALGSPVGLQSGRPG